MRASVREWGKRPGPCGIQVRHPGSTNRSSAGPIPEILFLGFIQVQIRMMAGLIPIDQNWSFRNGGMNILILQKPT